MFAILFYSQMDYFPLPAETLQCWETPKQKSLNFCHIYPPNQSANLLRLIFDDFHP